MEKTRTKPLNIKWHKPDKPCSFYIPLSTHQSLYPLPNIATTLLNIADQHQIKLPHISHTILNLMKNGTEQRPYGRIPYAVIVQSIVYISEQTGNRCWHIDRYMPGLYFPLEKFFNVIKKLKASSNVDIYINLPSKTTVDHFSDDDIVLSLLSIPNFAIKEEYAVRFKRYSHMFNRGKGPILLANDIDTVFSLINQATPEHAYKAIEIIGRPNFLGGLISLFTPDNTRQDYIVKVLKRYVDQEHRFCTAYHFVESTVKPEDLVQRKDILHYTIKTLAYTGMVGKLGNYISLNIDKLDIEDSQLLFLLSRIAAYTGTPLHTTLLNKLNEIYSNPKTLRDKQFAAYGIINLATFSDHTTSVKDLLKDNPITSEIDIPDRAIMLKLASIYKGIYPDVVKYIPLIRDTIEEVNDYPIHLKGSLIGTLAFLLEGRGDVPPSTVGTMYWQAMELDPMHSGEYFWLWFTQAPHAGIKYDTLKHFFQSLVLDIYDVFKPSELLTLYSAMAETSLIYGHMEDFQVYIETINELFTHSSSKWGKNMYYRLIALSHLYKEDFSSLKKIFNEWEKQGILLYWNDTKNFLEEIIKIHDHCPASHLPSDNETALYLYAKYCEKKEEVIYYLNNLLSLYTRRDNIINKAKTHTYLYRLLKDKDPKQALEHALASAFLYKEIDGIPPDDIQTFTNIPADDTNKHFLNLLIKKYIEKSRLLESMLSIISTSSKEEIMSKLLKMIPVPFFTAYGRYTDSHITIEGTYSIVGTTEDILNIPTTEKDFYSKKPATAMVHYQIGDKKLLIYIEHRYAENIYNKDTLKELKTFASEITKILSQVHMVERSQYDSLTGLLTRWFLVEEGPRMWNRAKREGYPISVIFIDTDNFKNINDTLGHNIGDKVLETVATIIKEETRISDRAIRYGGDEFIIILPFLGETDAYKVAERIKDLVSNTPLLKGNNITLSIGIYTSDNKHTLQEAIKKADKAMYIAKQEGKNRIVIYREN